MKKKRIFFILLFLFLVFLIFKFFLLEKKFAKKENLSFLIYDSEPVYVNIDLKEGGVFFSYLPLDYKIVVPGGYGNYRIGSIGKLSFLQKDEDILKRSFSFLFAFPLDFYFYSDLSKVYYKGGNKKNNAFESVDVKKIFFYKSNASFLERLFIVFKVLRSKDVFVSLSFKPEEVEDTTVNLQKFHKRIQGFFYNRRVREEGKNLKIIYSKYYSSAYNLSAVLEGIGVNVFGLEKEDFKFKDKCLIITDNISLTEEALSYWFNCKIKIDKQKDFKSVKFYLGADLEEKWR